MSVFLNFSGKTYALSKAQDIQTQIINLFQNLRLDYSSLRFKCNGKPLRQFDQVQLNSTIIANIPLLGGKGGYGAKLKNQGGKKVRPNDNKFSRDAHGRRIQYQMAEKQYTQFVKKRMAQDQKVNKERQQFKVMQQTMKQGSSFMKMDKKYNQQVEYAQNRLAQSIRIGKQKLLQKRNFLESYEKRQEQAEKEQKQYEQQKKQKSESFSQEKKQEKEQEEINNMQKPIKKVKIDAPVLLKIQSQGIATAKDKLKSLFRK